MNNEELDKKLEALSAKNFKAKRKEYLINKFSDKVEDALQEAIEFGNKEFDITTYDDEDQLIEFLEVLGYKCYWNKFSCSVTAEIED